MNVRNRKRNKLHNKRNTIIEGIDNINYSDANHSIPIVKSKSYIEIIPKKQKTKTVTVNKASIDGIFKFAKYSYRSIVHLYDEILRQYYKLKKKKNKCNGIFETSMKQLYEEVGDSIKTILVAFKNDDNESLSVLLADENYLKLETQLESFKGTDGSLFEMFRRLLTEALEGVKNGYKRMVDKKSAFDRLLKLYKALHTITTGQELLNTETDINVVAGILPEITEYIRRGYKLVNEQGELIPIDIDILNQIRRDMGILHDCD